MMGLAQIIQAKLFVARISQDEIYPARIMVAWIFVA